MNTPTTPENSSKKRGLPNWKEKSMPKNSEQISNILSGFNENLELKPFVKRTISQIEATLNQIKQSSREIKELQEELENYIYLLNLGNSQTLKKFEKGTRFIMKILPPFVKNFVQRKNEELTFLGKLRNGGLTELSEKIEIALQTANNQKESLIQGKQLLEKYLREVSTDLKKAEELFNFLNQNQQKNPTKDLSEKIRILKNIISSLKNQKTLLENGIHNAELGLEIWDTSIKNFFLNADKLLIQLAQIVLSATISESVGDFAKIHNQMKEIINQSARIPHQKLLETIKLVQELIKKPSLKKGTIEKLIELQQEINREMDSLRKLTKRPTQDSPESSLLEKLSKLSN